MPRKLRSEYIKSEGEHKQWLVNGKRSMLPHPAQRGLMRENINDCKLVVRAKGFIRGGRSEIIVIASPDAGVDFVVAGQHVIEAVYELVQDEPTNPNVMETIADTIPVTRLFDQTPSDVVKYFRDELNYLNHTKAASKVNFLQGYQEVPTVTDALKDHADKSTDPQPDHAGKEYDTHMWALTDDLFHDMYPNTDAWKNCRRFYNKLEQHDDPYKTKQYFDDMNNVCKFSELPDHTGYVYVVNLRMLLLCEEHGLMLVLGRMLPLFWHRL